MNAEGPTQWAVKLRFRGGRDWAWHAVATCPRNFTQTRRISERYATFEEAERNARRLVDQLDVVDAYEVVEIPSGSGGASPEAPQP